MCGPLQLALPMPVAGTGRYIVGRTIYQLGRLATYCLLGGLAGLIGKSFFLTGLQRWLSITLGVAMFAGFFLSKKIAVSTPVTRMVGKLKLAMSAQLRQRSLRSLALLGMLNGLLPCGLVYTALAWAVSAGHTAAAIVFMAVFGLGTLPMLLAIGFLGKTLPATVRLKLSRAIPFGIGLVAALLILRGLALGIPYLSPDLNGDAAACCVVGH
jgi:sulfite exporter TauE/SafE